MDKRGQYMNETEIFILANYGQVKKITTFTE